MSPSSSGLGRRPFTAETRVRFPLGTPTTAPMIKVIVIIYLFLINLTQAEDFYEYTITILWKQDSFKLADNN